MKRIWEKKEKFFLPLVKQFLKNRKVEKEKKKKEVTRPSYFPPLPKSFFFFSISNFFFVDIQPHALVYFLSFRLGAVDYIIFFSLSLFPLSFYVWV